MISFYTLSTVLVCHWLADFFFQTDEQAKGKSHCNVWLFWHVATYTLGLFIMALLNWTLFPHAGMFVAFVLINAVAHFFTDYVTSRNSSLLWKDGKMHDFFVAVGADQMLHYFTIFGTFVWLTH